MSGPRPPGRRPARLDLAVVLCGGLVTVAVVSPLANPAVADPGYLERTLTALAGLLLAILMVPRSPALAWAAAGAAAILAVQGPVALAAAREGSAPADAAGLGDWLVPSAVIALSAVGATLVTALHASRRAPPAVPGARGAAWLGLAWTVAAAGGAVALRAAGVASDPALTPLDVLQAPVAGWPLMPLALLLLGLAADARPPVIRARQRATHDGTKVSMGELGHALLEELSGRPATRSEAEAAERERLAADLHADVLPGLRGVLRHLEDGGDPAVAAARLRAIQDDLEAAMLARHNVILDQLGLIAALEWLAERSESRGLGTIELAIADPVPARAPGTDGRWPPPSDHAEAGGEGAPGRPPRAVERAALRVAELAISNATTHGDGRVEVTVGCEASRVGLVVTNRGPAANLVDFSAASSRGRRGVAEMRRVAGAVGAELEAGPGTPDGARVVFRWGGRHAGEP